MTTTSSQSEAPRRLRVSIASGDALDVRRFEVVERMNELFRVTIVALSENPDIDFEAVAGQPMSFTVQRDTGENDARTWSGLCSHIEQVAAEERGASTYRLVLVPALWLLTQRRNHRMFQRLSEVEIVRSLLAEWRVPAVENLSGDHKRRPYRVQYGESDFTFVCRMLEDAGVSLHFRTEGGETRVVLSDAPQLNPPRDTPIAFRDTPTVAAREHVTHLRVGRKIRPGKYTVRDHDPRRPPSYDLRTSAAEAGGVEESLEQFDYHPGAFLFETDKGDPAPAGDARGRFRTDDREAAEIAQRRLAAERGAARSITFDTNTVDLAPGRVVSFLDHPKSELAPDRAFLVLACSLTGTHDDVWTAACEAVGVGVPYRPPLVTPKPRTGGVESATVVGPGGEEIHTDELGRVRVHFHWDRESKMNEASSCWMQVSQPWGGAGFGGSNLPRVGQEVIVDFLGGDPDRPIIVGRVYTSLQSTPYKLPDNKTQSGWKSQSSPGGGPANYNEIMFEDRKGRELVRMQAEKDLDKLVKNDESVRIGHDRAKEVGNDDALTVGHDRTRRVENDETVSVGHDRTRQVEHDETISVGNDRTRTVEHDETVAAGNDQTITVGNDQTITVGNDRARTVGHDERVTIGNDLSRSVGTNESLFVGANQTEEIGANRSVKVGKSHSEKIKKSKSVKVGKAKSETVGLASTETVGLTKALTVGGAYAVTVGGMMTTNVMLMQKETVGKDKTITVGNKIEIKCGESRLVMEASGKITLEGTEISINGKKHVGIDSDRIDLD